jgi:hypothetical protein
MSVIPTSLQDAIMHIDKVLGTKVELSSLEQDMKDINFTFKQLNKKKQKLLDKQLQQSSKNYRNHIREKRESAFRELSSDVQMTSYKKQKLEKKIIQNRQEKSKSLI